MNEEKSSSENESKNNEEKIDPVFSEEEIRNTIKGFILALIRKEITVNLHAFEIADLAHKLATGVPKKEPTPEENFESVKARAEMVNKINSEFLDLMEICSGVKTATVTELKTAFNKLFKEILTLRFTGKIDGSFADYSLEQRLSKIEKKVQGDIEFMKTEIRWLKEQIGT